MSRVLRAMVADRAAMRAFAAGDHTPAARARVRLAELELRAAMAAAR